jgi:hypothetical protein
VVDHAGRELSVRGIRTPTEPPVGAPSFLTIGSQPRQLVDVRPAPISSASASPPGSRPRAVPTPRAASPQMAQFGHRRESPTNPGIALAAAMDIHETVRYHYTWVRAGVGGLGRITSRYVFNRGGSDVGDQSRPRHGGHCDLNHFHRQRRGWSRDIDLFQILELISRGHVGRARRPTSIASNCPPGPKTDYRRDDGAATGTTAMKTKPLRLWRRLFVRPAGTGDP